MPVYKVNVKWDKETFREVELNSDEPPAVFQAQLFALTSVPPERQKVMLKGAMLKEGGDWSKFKLKNKANIMLMGSAEAPPEAPTEVVRFVEDLSESERVAARAMPPGLINLGNTCYMNATVQCLRAAPRLRESLIRYASAGPAAAAAALPTSGITRALGQLYASMEPGAASGDVLRERTLLFLLQLRQLNPQFAQQDGGNYSQQDANECWGSVVSAIKQGLAPAAATGGNVVDRYFGIEQRDTMRCAEAPDEPASVSTQRALQLACHIEKDTGFVLAGVKRGLMGEKEKRSETLGRNAIYSTTGELMRLPEYLTINFVRFYYKQGAQENCKIRKEVKFSLQLDVHDLCGADLQARIKPAREQFAAFGDWETEQAASGNADAVAAAKTTLEPSELTHKGRSSDSGHYVGWAKQPDDGTWLMYDDDKVTPQTEADILKLSGGGGADWHTAYTLLYASKRCVKVPEAAASEAQAAVPAAMDTAAE
eukprot:UC1_evm1s2118